MNIKSKHLLLGCLAVAATTFNACAPSEPNSAHSEGDKTSLSEQIQSHVDRAYELAGDDFKQVTAELQCGNNREKVMGYFADKTSIPPTYIFDNLVYLGLPGVGAYALLSDEGIILIDALNSPEDIKTIVEPGLRELGLDPASIKDLIITQGHGDHYGGAQYIVDTYSPRVHMSGPDWDLVENPPEANPFADKSRFGQPPKRDRVLTDGQTLKLGNAEVTIVLTPGHSPATASLIIPVYDDGQRHMVGMWGGTAIPKDAELIKQYIASTQKFLEVSEKFGVDAEVNGHAFVDDALRRMQEIRENPDEENPFVIGSEKYGQYTQILEECAKAALLRVQNSSGSASK